MVVSDPKPGVEVPGTPYLATLTVGDYSSIWFVNATASYRQAGRTSHLAIDDAWVAHALGPAVLGIIEQ